MKLNNFRIKPRLIGAFLVVAAIAAVVGIVGLNQLKEVAEVRLPGVEGLQQMQASQQALLAIERGLINRRLADAATRERLWSKREQWLEHAKKGRELYEPLPKTGEEAAIWEEFKPLWEQWLKADEELASIQKEKDLLLQAGKDKDSKEMASVDDRAFQAYLAGMKLLDPSQEALDKLVALNTELKDQASATAERAITAVAGLEFRTYLMGTRVPPAIAAAEQALTQKHQLKSEPFKQEFNREVGRLFGTLLAERGHLVQVDFLDPEIVFLMDIEKSELRLRINPLFLYGRYRKLVRTMPQTRWPCRRCRGRGCPGCAFTGKTYQESVEELVSAPLLREARGSGTAFHGAGREDIDALMLGTGRPFALEIKEPKIRRLDLARLQQEINEGAVGRVEVCGLQFVQGSVVERLKKTEAEKTYEAKVRFARPVTAEQFQAVVGSLQGATIEQRTPSRVRHRRADLVRLRRVLEISGDLLSSTEAVIKIHCEGGLYIKELVSGDGGRTRPSLSELLAIPAAVTELNVLAVLGDFLHVPAGTIC